MGKKERIVYMKKGDTCLIIAGTLHKLISLLADENVQGNTILLYVNFLTTAIDSLIWRNYYTHYRFPLVECIL